VGGSNGGGAGSERPNAGGTPSGNPNAGAGNNNAVSNGNGNGNAGGTPSGNPNAGAGNNKVWRSVMDYPALALPSELGVGADGETSGTSPVRLEPYTEKPPEEE
jgi:hypothetical protein